MNDERLYVVRYSFDFAVPAVDEDEAIEKTDDALAELLGIESIDDLQEDLTKTIITDALFVVSDDEDYDDDEDEDEDEDDDGDEDED